MFYIKRTDAFKLDQSVDQQTIDLERVHKEKWREIV